jgi:hypothetical protein
MPAAWLGIPTTAGYCLPVAGRTPRRRTGLDIFPKGWGSEVLCGMMINQAKLIRYFWDAATDLFGKVSSFGPGWLF